jgi:hypothetical protein
MAFWNCVFSFRETHVHVCSLPGVQNVAPTLFVYVICSVPNFCTWSVKALIVFKWNQNETEPVSAEKDDVYSGIRN